MEDKINIKKFLNGNVSYLLLGENGSGKSTLIEKVVREAIDKKVILGYMPQISKISLSLKSEINRMRISGFPIIDSKMIQELLEKFEFKKLYNKNPKKMSDGQITMSKLIATLALNVNTYILDEFTNGLDPNKTTDAINSFIKLKANKGCNAIICTHNSLALKKIKYTKIKLKKMVKNNE